LSGWLPRHLFTFRLAVVTLLGLALRLAYVVHQEDREVIGDGNYYHFLARNLADGAGFINPVSYLRTGVESPDALHPPAWSAVLAVPTWLGFDSYHAHQVFGCLVGTLTVVLVGFAGRRIAGPRTGILAALLAAVYPNLWIYEREIMSETLLFPLVALTVILAYRFVGRPDMTRAALVGVACGLLALTRAEQMLHLIVLLAPLVLLVGGVPLRRRAAWLAAGTAAMAVVIAPWAAYNTSRFQNPVVITTSAGHGLRLGNCELNYYGELIGTRQRRCPDVVPLRGDPSVRDAARGRLGREYVLDHLGRVPLAVFAKEGRTWGFWNPLQQSRLDSARNTSLGVIRAGYAAYYAIAPAAVAGAVILRRRRVRLTPLLAFVAVVVVAVAPTWGQVRFRAAAEIPLVLLAAVAGTALFDLVVRHVRKQHRGTASERAGSGQDPSRTRAGMLRASPRWRPNRTSGRRLHPRARSGADARRRRAEPRLRPPSLLRHAAA